MLQGKYKESLDSLLADSPNVHIITSALSFSFPVSFLTHTHTTPHPYNTFFFFPLLSQHVEIPRPGIKFPQRQWPKPLQRQHWVFNPLHHKELYTFFFFWPPLGIWSSWVRDQIRAATVAYATAVGSTEYSDPLRQAGDVNLRPGTTECSWTHCATVGTFNYILTEKSIY